MSDQALEFFIGAAFLPMPETKDRPATDPLRWADFEAQFGGRPYESPRDEYIQNRFPLNLQTLLYRWADLGFDVQIYKMLADDNLRMERIAFQDHRRSTQSLPNPKDPAYIERQNAFQAQLCIDRIDYLNYLLEQNVDITVEQYFRLNEGGTVIKEEVHTLSQANRQKIEKDLREWILLHREMTGQNVKKVEHDVGDNLRETMLEQMRAENHQSKTGHTLDELESYARNGGRALPEPSYVEGEVLEPILVAAT